VLGNKSGSQGEKEGKRRNSMARRIDYKGEGNLINERDFYLTTSTGLMELDVRSVILDRGILRAPGGILTDPTVILVHPSRHSMFTQQRSK
jgi:hypothetical protein